MSHAAGIQLLDSSHSPGNRKCLSKPPPLASLIPAAFVLLNSIENVFSPFSHCFVFSLRLESRTGESVQCEQESQVHEMSDKTNSHAKKKPQTNPKTSLWFDHWMFYVSSVRYRSVSVRQLSGRILARRCRNSGTVLWRSPGAAGCVMLKPFAPRLSGDTLGTLACVRDGAPPEISICLFLASRRRLRRAHLDRGH